MIDKDLVRRKLARLSQYLTRLSPLAQKTLNEYKNDDYLRFSTERLIELIVECAVDVNNHVVVEAGNRPPEDYTTSFSRAAETGLISRDLADKLKGSAGMRNVLVHEYMDIDDEMVFRSIPLALDGFKEFIKQAERFIEKLETTG